MVDPLDLVCQSPWLAPRWLSPLVDLPDDLGSLGHWVLICKMNDILWSKHMLVRGQESIFLVGNIRQWEDR